MQEGSLFSTLSPVFIVCRFFDDGHSDKSKVISHCISLIMSDGEHLSFHVIISHLYVFFGEMSG